MVRPIPGRTPPGLINLYSDTQTKPSRAMREAIMSAEVGDEQRGEDPSVNALCERMADLMGKEAAVFMPSGTMCNEVAVLVHCRPGDEVIGASDCHILGYEGGAPAALAGVLVTPLASVRGQFTPEQVEAGVRFRSRYSPNTRLMTAEQTANMGGGAVWPVAQLNAVAQAAKKHGLATHLDGARLMNAVVASGVAAKEHAAGFDTAWLDFTKGLGAPIGAVLCGSREMIDIAWRWKQRMGGALRQGGIAAAGCLYALDHNIERLAEDHANARALAAGLGQLPGVTAETPETNLVFFDVSGTGMTGDAFCRAMEAEGVRVGAQGPGPGRVRACTHLDISAADIRTALDVAERVVTRARKAA
ncbi:threonine aldolase family protein [Elioraea rosea]|uniref:threonine aldolase family protein n=1 Tax=Elioraea rosea TaxID=2492390 RepID=UPI0011837DBA|nr:GntG family PLP-dependent aldolase [Elioraea rosea]